MAGILDRYGIKEVADVTFYKIGKSGAPEYPVLYLDTLKVSTIEQSADEATANGGKGNPPLVIWDYNKDITVTLEDALFSAKSLAIMFSGSDKPVDFGYEDTGLIMKTDVFTFTGTNNTSVDDVKAYQSKTNGYDPNYEVHGKAYAKQNPKFYDELGREVDNLDNGKKYFCSFDLVVRGQQIDISANSFPGTYYVTGDTYARSDVTGDDDFFQFIIYKAKVQSENTITLEADGDPSTFNMSLHVMRPENGVMMKLVKYEALDDTEASASAGELYHNHYLDTPNTDAAKALRANTYVLKREPLIAEDGITSAGSVNTTGLKVFKYDANGEALEAVTTGLTVTPATVSASDNGNVTFTVKHSNADTGLTFVANVNISA